MSDQPTDLSGKRYGILTVIGAASSDRLIRDGQERRAWRVRCDCGGERIIRESRLLQLGLQACTCGRIKGFESAMHKLRTNGPPAGTNAPEPELVKYPDERLSQPSRPVAIHDAATAQRVQALVAWLRNTMARGDANGAGVGISAVQIGVPVRVFIVHVPRETMLPIVFVNPEIIEASAKLVELDEGCLSFKDVRERIERPETVTVKRWDDRGRCDTHEFTKWTARVIQHEMDHLDGVLFIDHLSPARRRMVCRRFELKRRKREEKVA